MAKKKLPDRTCRKCGKTYPRSAGRCPACAKKKTGKKKGRGASRPGPTRGKDLSSRLVALIDERVERVAERKMREAVNEGAVRMVVDERLKEVLGG